MNKSCRYCHEKPASSKEHLIASSRLSRIKSFKEEDNRNDNIRKTFKGITCSDCNNELGKYERDRWSNLAYATIWKVLAGNINSAFSSKEHQLTKTTKEDIELYEKQVLESIQKKLSLVANTFHFDFDSNSLIKKNQHTTALKKVCLNLVDESGNPVEGAKVYTKDKGGSEDEKGYLTESNVDGKAELKILMAYESVFVVPEKITITNQSTFANFCKEIDFIIYMSFDANQHRLIVILPIIGKIQTKWNDAELAITHKSFLDIAKEYVKDINITNVVPYFNL